MGTQEWILLTLVLVIPLLIAIVVTLWTLEQALKRNKKNREDKVVRRASEPVSEEPPLPNRYPIPNPQDWKFRADRTKPFQGWW